MKEAHSIVKQINEGGLKTKGYYKISCPSTPLVTIVTVVLNGEKYLERTVKSVLNQTYKNTEFIIIDGGSTDQTLTIVKKYEDAIDYWVSEPDEGIYDAMNKGLDLASGDYYWFINAGDEIYSRDTISKVFEIANDADVYYGKTELLYSPNRPRKLTKTPRMLTWKSMSRGMVVCHQSVIVKASVAPRYDLKFKLASDHDWIIRILKESNNIINTNMVLSRYLLGGFAQNNFMNCWKEEIRIVKQYYSLSEVLANYVIYLRAYIKYLIKRLLYKHLSRFDKSCGTDMIAHLR